MIGISNIKTIILDEIAYAKPEILLQSLYYINNMSLHENFKILNISTPIKTKENELNVFKELYDLAGVKHSLYWWNDERYSENLIWVKDDDILYRKNSDNFNELYENGWKPISPWYIKMCEGFHSNEDKIRCEFDCEF